MYSYGLELVKLLITWLKIFNLIYPCDLMEIALHNSPTSTSLLYSLIHRLDGNDAPRLPVHYGKILNN